MFKSLYKKLVIDFLGEYIENFDEKSVEVNKWEGVVKKDNLILKSNALNTLSYALGLPVKVKYGVIKKLEMSVEWEKFISSPKPSQILISELHVICEFSHSFCEEFADKLIINKRKNEIEKKFKKLSKKIFPADSDVNLNVNLTWKNKIMRTFFQNINITIENIHIRFEENYKNKKFNFGLIINLFELLNTNKYGEEKFYDYETRNKLGRSFYMLKFTGLSFYFNPSSNNLTNFLEIKDENLINYIKLKSKSTESLPPVYEHFLDFSSKFFNHHSFEYSKQFFIISPLDFSIKYRRSNNYQDYILPTNSAIIDINEININFNDSIMKDIFYIQELKKYHSTTNLPLKMKRMFLVSNFSKQEYRLLFRNAILLVIKNKNECKCNMMCKRLFYKTIQNAVNYHHLFYSVLLNENEYTNAKTSNQELFTCNVNNKMVVFQSYNELQNQFAKTESELNEKLIYQIRLKQLLKFKNSLINELNTSTEKEKKTGIIGGIFRLFSRKDTKPNSYEMELIKESILTRPENEELIDNIISGKINNYPEKINEISKINKRNFILINIKIDQFSINFYDNQESLLKFKIENLFVQLKTSNISKKLIVLLDKLILIDQSLGRNKFSFIFSPSNESQKSSNNLSNALKKRVYDDLNFDNDAIYVILSRKKIFAHCGFIKIYRKTFNHEIHLDSYKDTTFYRNTTLMNIESFDIFLNLKFIDKFINLLSNIMIEKSFITSKNLSENHEINLHELEKNIKQINNFNFFDIIINKVCVFLPFSIDDEDYRSYLFELEKINYKTKAFEQHLLIQNICMKFYNNFLLLINNVPNLTFTNIMVSFSLSITSLIKSNTKNIYMNIQNEINFLFDKKLFINLSDLYMIIKRYFNNLELKLKNILQVKEQNKYTIIKLNNDIADKTIQENFEEIKLKSIYNDSVSYKLSNSIQEEFKEVFEDLDDSESVSSSIGNESNLILNFPILLKTESIYINFKSIKLGVELFNELNNLQENSKFLIFSFNQIKAHIEKNLDTEIIERRLTFNSFDIYFESLNNQIEKINQENILLIIYQKLYNNVFISEIDLNLGKLTFKNIYIKDIISFYLLIGMHFSHLHKDEIQNNFFNISSIGHNIREETKENLNNTFKPRKNLTKNPIYDENINSKIMMNLNLNSLEYSIDHEKSIYISMLVKFENYLNKSVKLLFYKLNIFDSLKTFSISIGNLIDNMSEENYKIELLQNIIKNSTYLNINILDINLDHSLTKYFKDIISLEKYLDFIKQNIDKTKRHKEKCIISPSPQMEIQFYLKKINFSLNLYEDFNLTSEVEKFKFDYVNKQIQVENNSFKLNLNSNKVVNSTEFFILEKFSVFIDHDTDNLTIFIENVAIKIKFTDVLISRQISKFFMNCSQLFSQKLSQERKMIQSRSQLDQNSKFIKNNIVFKMNNLEVNIFDIFLKENLEFSTINDKFFLNLKILKFILEKREKKFGVMEDLFLNSSETLLKENLNETKASFNILLQSTSEKIIKPLKKEHLSSITIIMIPNKSIIIDLVNIQVIFSEHMFTVEKMVRKYNTVLNYTIRNDIKSSSNSKGVSLIISVLQLSLLKIIIKDINIKMKKYANLNNLKHNINFAFEFEFDFQNLVDGNKTSIINYGANIREIQLFSRIKRKGQNFGDNFELEKDYFVYPFDITLKTEQIENKFINIEISLIEIDLSMKKIALLSNFMSLIKEFESNKSKRKNRVQPSKRELLKLFLFEGGIKMTMKNFVIIFAKEEIGKIYNPLFSLEMENFNIKMNQKSLIMNGFVKSEYFNNFNEFWEPFLEKSNIELTSNENKYFINFQENVNCNISLAFIKVVETLIQESKNFNNYKDTFMIEDFNNRIIEEEDLSGDISVAKTNFSKKKIKIEESKKKLEISKSISHSKIFNPKIKRLFSQPINPNIQNLQEKLNSNINFYLQIRNLTGVELLLISVEKNEIIKKIINEEIISIKKLISKNETPKKTINKRISKISSQSSLVSIPTLTENCSEFKSTAQAKYRKQNERINSVKSLKHIYFKIPSLNKKFSLNLFKPYQEIEIDKESNNHKIIVDITIDTYGRKIISLKSPIIIKNHLKTEIQLLLSEKEDFNDKTNFSMIIKPFAESYVPLTNRSFEYLKVRPYQDDKTINFYQNFHFSEVFSKDSILHNKGKYLKCFNKDENYHFHLVSYNLGLEGNSIENFIIFDYSLEVNNILPYDILFYFDKNNLSNEEVLSKKNKFFLSKNFSQSMLNTLTFEEIHEYLYVIMANNFSSNQSVKKIELNKFLCNETHQEAILDFKNQFEEIKIKVLYKTVFKKLKIMFYVDFVIINELENNINIIINKNYDKRILALESLSVTKKYQEKIVKNNRERGYSIESDLLTSNKSKTNFNDLDNLQKCNLIDKQEISVNLIELKNVGLCNFWEKYNNMISKTDEMSLNLNQLGSKTYDDMIYLENQINKINFYSIPLINEIHKLNIIKNNSFKLVSLTDETVYLQIDHSCEILANFIKDELNVYKNQYLEFIFKNKNQLDILTNIKYLNEYIVSDVADSIRDFSSSNVKNAMKFGFTKIVNLSPKYIIINKSNLNLIVTQDQCFDEGFYIIHAYSRMSFKWINYEKPFLIKLKSKDSFFTKAFSLENIGEFNLNLKTLVQNVIVKISVIENLGTTIVYIQDSTNEPPLYIENLSNLIVKVSEKSINYSNYVILNPLMSNPFCLEDNSNPIEIYICNSLESFDSKDNFKLLTSVYLEEEYYKSIKFPRVKINLKKNENMGLNYSLIIKDLKSIDSEQESIKEYESSFSFSSQDTKIVYSELIKTKVNFNSLGISLIDQAPKELSYIFFKNSKFSIKKIKNNYSKIKFQIGSAQIDNCLEDGYYLSPLKTTANKKDKLPFIKAMIDYNFNKVGYTIFINNCTIEVNSRTSIMLDGLFLSEIWNYFKNLRKIINTSTTKKNLTESYLTDKQYLFDSNEEKNSTKVFINKLSISDISILFSFKPSYNLIKYLSTAQMKIFLIFKVENMEIIFDKFETKGTKSLDTVSKMLGKSFVNKNSILTKYLFSTGILFNFNNIFKNFKYGFGSIMESMKTRKKQSIMMVPKQILEGGLRVCTYFIVWVKNILNPIRKLMNLVFMSSRVQVDIYYDFEKRMKNNFSLFKCLKEDSKLNFRKYLYHSKPLYFLSRKSMEIDRKKFISISQTFRSIRNQNKFRIGNIPKHFIRVLFLPLKALLFSFNYAAKFLSKMFREEKVERIRYPRYINKNSSKIENYSESRALAYQNIIKNKKKLNILEDIEQYFNLSNNDSVILTNLRIIHIENKSSSPLVRIIELESIYFIDNTSPGQNLKLFYFDDNYTKIIENEENLLDENYYFKYKFTRKTHLALKIFEVRSNGCNKDFEKLNKIYDWLKESYPYKLTKKSFHN